MSDNLYMFVTICMSVFKQRPDEEAVVDQGGTSTILNIHYEKEELEGKSQGNQGRSPGFTPHSFSLAVRLCGGDFLSLSFPCLEKRVTLMCPTPTRP